MHVYPLKTKECTKRALVHSEGESADVTVAGHGEHVFEVEFTGGWTRAQFVEYLLQCDDIDYVLADSGVGLPQDRDIVCGHFTPKEIETD